MMMRMRTMMMMTRRMMMIMMMVIMMTMMMVRMMRLGTMRLRTMRLRTMIENQPGRNNYKKYFYRISSPLGFSKTIRRLFLTTFRRLRPKAWSVLLQIRLPSHFTWLTFIGNFISFIDLKRKRKKVKLKENKELKLTTFREWFILIFHESWDSLKELLWSVHPC